MSVDSPEPEPVDAEFEPADDSPPAEPNRKGVGAGAVFGLFLTAAILGGVLGFTADRLMPPPAPSDEGVRAELAAQAEIITALEARLAELEAAGPVAPAELDPAVLAALDSRLAALEAEPAQENGAPPVDLAPIEARLSALESAAPAAGVPADLLARLERVEAEGEAARSDLQQDLLNQMEARLAALSDSVSESLAEAGPELSAPGPGLDAFQALEARLSAVESAPAPQSPADLLADMTARLTALERALDAVDARVRDASREAGAAAQSAAESAQQIASGEGEAARLLAARALALTALKEISASGQAFEAERAALARLWRGRAELAALSRHARTGALRAEDLAARYPGEAIRETAGPGRMFFGLIEVARTAPDANETGPLALTALAEARLAENDLAGAVMLTERLEGEALEAGRAWLAQARARLETDASLAALSEALRQDAAEQGADPT